MWFWEVPFFPPHVVSLAFDLEMWGVSGKTSGSGELDVEKQLRISVLGKHKKLRFNTYAFPSTMVMGAGNLIAFPCHFGIFVRIHMRVSMFLWKHIPNVDIFDHHVYRCGNTSLTHTRFQSLFMSLCENTYVFTCSGSVKSRNTCAFPCFLL